MRADTPLYLPSSRRRTRTRSLPTIAAVLAAGLALLAVLVGLAFAGPKGELAEGTEVAGVDVGGLTRREAVAKLDALFARVEPDPVRFTAGGSSFRFAANQLAVEPDWSGAVAAAGRAGEGFGPIRGFRRLRTRFFGAEILPRVGVSNAALEFALDRISARVDRDPRSAALVRRGLRVATVPGQLGRVLDRDAAAATLVRALGSLERSGAPVPLPVALAQPPVTVAMLAPAAERARIAVSRPVYLRGAGRSWRLPRARVAQLLELPADGARRLRIGGDGAEVYFRRLGERVGRPPRDAGFSVYGEAVQVVPARTGIEVDVPKTARAILVAASRRENRVARLVLARAAPDRTTAEALAMGIDRRMSVYKTYYSGTADRITNLRLGVTYLDGTLVPPGGTFSLNDAIGERTIERGFRSAPVIIGTEYAEEIGGGTSQVATTVFNAAWEAGLKIGERHPHSLYISRYQLGRDATVYWPSLDLKFVNDTNRWILVKGFAESDGISVAVYGGETRRVESSATPLVVTGRVPVERVKDPTLAKGKIVVEEEGTSPTRTTATRRIYAADGSLLRSETWTTSYEGETRIVRVGTKEPKPKQKPKQEARPPGATPGDTTDEPSTATPPRP